VSVHGATFDGNNTVIGSDNTILAYSHVAHDCVLGNHIVASNSVGLAGHVIVEDHVTFGALCGIHQFCRIGAYSMVSAFAKVVQDITPFLSRTAARNYSFAEQSRFGTQRLHAEQLDRVKQIYRLLFRED